MYIVGLNIGHNATACLMHNGVITSCVSEERFSRIKNHSGIPFKSIEYVLSEQKIRIEDVDLIVLDDHYPINNDPHFGKKFLNDYTHKSLKNRVLSKVGYSFPSLFSLYQAQKRKRYLNKREKIRAALKNEIAKQLNYTKEKIECIDHHYAHAFATYPNLPKDKKTLIFTLDGEGSGLSATVNIADGNGIKTIASTEKSASLGYFYAIATLWLGMKPLEHEFKVMGLAPYAKQHSIEKVYEKIKKIFRIEDLEFHSKFNMPFADHFFNRELKFVRFDTLAGAVQKLTEELVMEWIREAIRTTNIHSIALSGGVFMNVKANQKIDEMPEVAQLFIMPSAGDESNAIGCCNYGCLMLTKKQNKTYEPQKINHLYLGPEYEEEYVKKLIETNELEKKYKIKKSKSINADIAKLLAKGEIVARCTGRSEWGARALGNRSILANPNNTDTIRILNETIKDRDFWMPFTPSMLEEDASLYFDNPKKVSASFMAITFHSKKLAKKDLPAAMHPYDLTIRPQLVSSKTNKEYHLLLKEFKKLTGVGCLLNTSFNLHGEPNVLTPEDALHTMDNSSLKYVAIGNYLFEKEVKKYRDDIGILEK